MNRYDWHAPEPTNESCNATVHVKFEHDIDQLQAQIRRLQGQVGVHDLDPIVLEELQMSVMDDDEEIEFIPTLPNPIVKIEPNDFDYGETNDSENGMNDTENAATSNDNNMTTASNSDGIQTQSTTQNGSIDRPNIQNAMIPVQSIFDSVAGYINFTVDVIRCIFPMFGHILLTLCFHIHLKEKFDRHFASADVTIQNSIWTLLDFYNNNQAASGAGELHDLKYIDLLLKGILGWEIMAEMDLDPDFEDPKLILAKGIFNLFHEIDHSVRYAV